VCGQEAWAEDGKKHNVVHLKNLEPNTWYYFEVMSQAKDYAYDAFYSFEVQ